MRICNNIHRAACLAVLLCLAHLTGMAQQRRYVTAAGAGEMDGTSWGNASPHLQETIDGCTPGDTVWVARGSFTGGFIMREGVTVIGGFDGNEQRPEERNIDLEPATLTRLEGDGKYRVLLQERVFDTPTTWDGFVLTGGIGSKGAGAFLRQGGTLANCIVEGNTAGKIALGEYSKEEGGILIYIQTNKVCIMAMEEAGRYFQSERAAEIAKQYDGAGFSNWRLPTAPELRALIPGTDAQYSSLRLTELAIAEKKGTPLSGKRYWTSTSATSNGMKGAGCCDFACEQYFPLNTYQYNKVRPVRECAHPTVQGMGAGVYAEGGRLMLCQVSGNLGANDIDSTGDLEIIEPTPDGIGNAAGTVLLRRVWKAGEVAEPPHALSTTLYDTSGRTVCQGAGQLKLPAMPGLYILQWQTGECVSSQRITIIP